MTNVLGPDHLIKSNGRAYLVQFDSKGVFGWIPTHQELISQFLSGKSIYFYLFIYFFAGKNVICLNDECANLNLVVII